MALTEARVAVIGGGAVGVSTAFELSRRGARVTLFEGTSLGTGASYGNAGLLVPSYSTPLATRDNLFEGLRSIFGAASAVDVKLAPTWRTLSWLVRFAISASPQTTRRGTETLAALTQQSLALFAELLAGAPSSISYETQGTIYVAKTESTLGESIALADRLALLGIASRVLTASEARAREPLLSQSIAGAVWYPGDAKLQPFHYVNYVSRLAVDAGATICNERVTGIVAKSDGIQGIRTAIDVIDVDRVVVAAGVWSDGITAPLGLRVPINPAKGYSMDVTLSRSPRAPMLFSERHVSVTPMNGTVRATTGLDFHGYDTSIAQERLAAIREAYAEYLEGATIVEETPAWAGFRPLTPDGLPIIGVSGKIRGLLFATGHGPLGITLAPVTAQLVANAILDESTTPAAVSPSRFGI